MLAGAIAAIVGATLPRRASSLSPADYTWIEERTTDIVGLDTIVAIDPASPFDRSVMTWWSSHNGELVLKGVEYDVERMTRTFKRCLEGGDQPAWMRISDSMAEELGLR